MSLNKSRKTEPINIFVILEVDNKGFLESKNETKNMILSGIRRKSVPKVVAATEWFW